jgi:hypothetical protein
VRFFKWLSCLTIQGGTQMDLMDREINDLATEAALRMAFEEVGPGALTEIFRNAANEWGKYLESHPDEDTPRMRKALNAYRDCLARLR